jgi:hypothetical protein
MGSFIANDKLYAYNPKPGFKANNLSLKFDKIN